MHDACEPVRRKSYHKRSTCVIDACSLVFALDEVPVLSGYFCDLSPQVAPPSRWGQPGGAATEVFDLGQAQSRVFS